MDKGKRRITENQENEGQGQSASSSNNEGSHRDAPPTGASNNNEGRSNHQQDIQTGNSVTPTKQRKVQFPSSKSKYCHSGRKVCELTDSGSPKCNWHNSSHAAIYYDQKIYGLEYIPKRKHQLKYTLKHYPQPKPQKMSDILLAKIKAKNDEIGRIANNNDY